MQIGGKTPGSENDARSDFDQRPRPQPDLMSGDQIGRDGGERHRQIFDPLVAHVFLHLGHQPPAADQAAAAHAQIQIADDLHAAEIAGPLLQRIQMTRQIAAADQGADRCAGDDIRLYAQPFKSAQDADMSPPTGDTGSKRQADAGTGSDQTGFVGHANT